MFESFSLTTFVCGVSRALPTIICALSASCALRTRVLGLESTVRASHSHSHFSFPQVGNCTITVGSAVALTVPLVPKVPFCAIDLVERFCLPVASFRPGIIPPTCVVTSRQCLPLCFFFASNQHHAHLRSCAISFDIQRPVVANHLPLTSLSSTGSRDSSSFVRFGTFSHTPPPMMHLGQEHVAVRRRASSCRTRRFLASQIFRTSLQSASIRSAEEPLSLSLGSWHISLALAYNSADSAALRCLHSQRTTL